MSGVTRDRNDCVVNAFAIATGIDYSTSFELHKAAGRKSGRRTKQGLYERAWRDAGWELAAPLSDPPRTLQTLMRDRRLESGVWIVRVRGHLLCVRDGVMHETGRLGAHVISVHRLRRL